MRGSPYKWRRTPQEPWQCSANEQIGAVSLTEACRAFHRTHDLCLRCWLQRSFFTVYITQNMIFGSHVVWKSQTGHVTKSPNSDMLASQNAEAISEEHWTGQKISLSTIRRIFGETAFRVVLPLKEQFIQNFHCNHLLVPLFKLKLVWLSFKEDKNRNCVHYWSYCQAQKHKQVP